MDMYRGQTPSADQGSLGRAGQTAVAALVVPLIAAGSFLLYLMRGPLPRIGGAVSGGERRLMRRRLRGGLRLLDRPDGFFRLSEAVPFSWQSLAVIAGGDDCRDRFPGLAAAEARRMTRQTGDVMVLERAPGAYVWIAFGPSPGIVGDQGLAFGAIDVVFTPAMIDGVRQLRLSPAPVA